MKIRNLGDKIEIIETVEEVNKRYSDLGFPEPVYLVDGIDPKIISIKTYIPIEEAKHYGITLL